MANTRAKLKVLEKKEDKKELKEPKGMMKKEMLMRLEKMKKGGIVKKGRC